MSRGFRTRSTKQWSRLTPRQRKQANLTLPSRFLTRELKEDITSTQTKHVKSGGIIANYRIIDAVDGELVHTNNLSSEASFEDDSVDGIEIGRFIQKAKVANLPAGQGDTPRPRPLGSGRYRGGNRRQAGTAGAAISGAGRTAAGGREAGGCGGGSREGDRDPGGQGSPGGGAHRRSEATCASSQMTIHEEDPHE